MENAASGSASTPLRQMQLAVQASTDGRLEAQHLRADTPALGATALASSLDVSAQPSAPQQSQNNRDEVVVRFKADLEFLRKEISLEFQQRDREAQARLEVEAQQKKITAQTISDLNAHVESLRGEVQRLEGEKAQAKERHDNFEEKFKVLEVEKLQAARQAEAAEETSRRQREEVAAGWQAQSERLQSDVAQFKAQSEQLQSDVAQFKAQSEQFQSAAAQVKQTVKSQLENVLAICKAKAPESAMLLPEKAVVVVLPAGLIYNLGLAGLLAGGKVGALVGMVTGPGVIIFIVVGGGIGAVVGIAGGLFAYFHYRNKADLRASRKSNEEIADEVSKALASLPQAPALPSAAQACTKLGEQLSRSPVPTGAPV